MNVPVTKSAPVLRAQGSATNASPHRLNKRAIWDLVIGIAGLIYLGVVLFADLRSPAFGLALVLLAAYEVLEPRCGKRGG